MACGLHGFNKKMENKTILTLLLILTVFANGSLAGNKTIEQLRDIGYGWLRCSALSTDGKRLATGSLDCTIYLWDVESGKVIKTFKGHTDDINALAFLSNGNEIVSGSDDATIRIWNVQTGNLVRTIKGHSFGINSIAVSPDDSTILSGSNDGTVKLWNCKTGNLIWTYYPDDSQFLAVAFSPDGSKILASSGFTYLLNRESGKAIDTFKIHNVSTVAFSPDGSKALTGFSGLFSGEDSVWIWDIATGKKIKTYPAISFSLAFSRDGLKIISGGNGTATIYNCTTEKIDTVLHAHSYEICFAAFSPDATEFFTGSYDGTIKRWNTASFGLEKTYYGHTVRLIHRPAFFPDESKITAGSSIGTIMQWDTETGELVHVFQCPEKNLGCLYFHILEGKPRILTIAVDEFSINDNNIKVWSMETGELVRQYADVKLGLDIKTVVFSPDDSLFLVLNNWGKIAKLFDTQTGKYIRTFAGHTDEIRHALFSPDSKKIITSSGWYKDSTVKIWDVETGMELNTIDMYAAKGSALAISPDGSRVATSHGNTLKLWNVETGGPIGSLKVPSDLNYFGFSPKGPLTILGSKDNKEITLYTETGDTIRFTEDSRMRFSDFVLFTKDGSKALVFSPYSGMKLFDVSNNISAAKNDVRSGDVIRKKTAYVVSNTLRINADLSMAIMPIEIVLYNLKGGEVFQKTLSNKTGATIDCPIPATLSSGIYFFKVKQPGNVYHGHFTYWK